jgi:hypothetical protein
MTNSCSKQADRRPTDKQRLPRLQLWPAKVVRAKIVVLGLDDASVGQ